MALLREDRCPLSAAIMAVFKPTPRVLKSTGASPYFFYIIYF